MPDSKLVDVAIQEVTDMQGTDLMYLVRNPVSITPLDNKISFDNLSRSITDGLQATAITETPSGVIDGINPTFNLSFVPLVGSLMVFKNGLMQNISPSGDLVVSGLMLTFNIDAIPLIGDTITAVYRK